MKENFDNGIYKSMDKQVLRDFGIIMVWKNQYKLMINHGYLKQGGKLEVYVPQEINHRWVSTSLRYAKIM